MTIAQELATLADGMQTAITALYDAGKCAEAEGLEETRDAMRALVAKCKG